VILPAALEWLGKLGKTAKIARELVVVKGRGALPEEAYYNRARAHLLGLMEALDKLDAKHIELDAMSGTEKKAKAARDALLPLLAGCRLHADALETLMDDNLWPLPKYNELLWSY
jgi:glutamine synthetase